jgi:hypothetical protein
VPAAAATAAAAAAAQTSVSTCVNPPGAAAGLISQYPRSVPRPPQQLTASDCNTVSQPESIDPGLGDLHGHMCMLLAVQDYTMVLTRCTSIFAAPLMFLAALYWHSPWHHWVLCWPPVALDGVQVTVAHAWQQQQQQQMSATVTVCWNA